MTREKLQAICNEEAPALRCEIEPCDSDFGWSIKTFCGTFSTGDIEPIHASVVGFLLLAIVEGHSLGVRKGWCKGCAEVQQ